MRLTINGKPAWVEGAVSRRGDHVSISYGEGRRVVALIAQQSREFRVQFLLKEHRGDVRATRILEDVRRELTHYLLHAVGRDAWPFVQYHCQSPANLRSMVHWHWHPARPGDGA